ncbi:MAG: A24 family peptidase [Bryobacteraceae bacterium]
MPIRVALSAVLVTAAFIDWRARRIPNWLTLPAVPAGVAAQTLYADGFWYGLAGALAAAALFFLPFAAGALGAGDVKLFAAVGAFVGIRNLLAVFVLVALIGGILALVVSLRAGALGRVLRSSAGILGALGRRDWAELKQRSDVDRPDALRLAYGVVIAVGTLLFLWVPR